MNLVHILVFISFSLLVRWFCPTPWRGWLMLLGSLLAVFWLQPSTPIRYLDFWLPVISIALTIFTWAIIQPSEPSGRRPWLRGLIFIAGCILAVGALRYFPGICCLSPSRPPGMIQVIIALIFIFLLFSLIKQLAPGNRWISAGAVGFLLILFVILKSPNLAYQASAALRAVQGQSTDLASVTDLSWLGFSYLAFRLIHVLRDFHINKSTPATIEEFSVYALFYPAITAGPIDRLPRFIPDIRAVNQPGKNSRKFPLTDARVLEDTFQGGRRILVGIFKKFVLADSLALISLNSQNILQVDSAFWMWVLLYSFGLRLYFDFAGYTDIAIGLGRIAGIRLPENFNRPYLQPNLTAFWNSWHMTLAQWFRAYFFNPLTRFLRVRYQKIPAWSLIFVGQLSTMILIGLWHGITWNFFAWGAWHGAGLFIHNRWLEWRRARYQPLNRRPFLSRAAGALGVLATFHFVLLGWVWFAMPNMIYAMEVFQKLLGRN